MLVRFGRTALHAGKRHSELKHVTSPMYACNCKSAAVIRCCRVISSKSTDPVVIRVPKPMVDRLEKAKQTKLGTAIKVPVVRSGKLLIKSKNPLLNQSAGEIIGKFERTRLCSQGWKHPKSDGDYFTINSTQTLPPFVEQSEHREADGKPATFKCFQIHDELVEILRQQDIVHPTSVQRKVIPRVLRGHNVLCAAETGSGKTLTYLLPIVHDIQVKRELNNQPYTHSVILVPSRELTEQVTAATRLLGKHLDLNVKVLGGGRGVGKIKTAFTHGPPDILISTPGALVKATYKKFVDLSRVRFIVIDEADTMFDPSFSSMIERILKNVEVASSIQETRDLYPKAQLLLVGATFPAGVGELLSQVTDLGSILTIKSQRLHHLMPHVKQTFVKVKGADKLIELNYALNKVEGEHRGVLVFCNSAATVNWLGFSLEDLGVRHIRLQGEMPASMRQDIFRNFQKGKVDVLVCTDIASRGLDTQRVKLVVNYDFPQSQTDYIHRAGRVGRAGGQERGEVLSFVTHKWDVELVQKLEIAARKKRSLTGLESHIREPTSKTEEIDDW